MNKLEELLNKLVTLKGSDLHILPNEKPKARVDGKLITLEDFSVLTESDTKTLCYLALNEKEQQEFQENLEMDFMIETDTNRFRANYYFALGGIASAFRVIPSVIPSLDELNSPLIYKELVKREKGLILVTGATGSGKSTTLAGMLNEINITEKKHIITIEDPVEFIHKNKNSLFSQRNIGKDSKSFTNALKYVLRQDPDVILIGEMRDKETIKAAITAAETGHLVFATLHSNSSVQTIDRILDTFSAEEQSQVRVQLAFSLIASISQVLVPKINGGRIAVSEILINTPAIANLIREGKNHQIPSQMQLGQAMGMQSQASVLKKLIKDGLITLEEAKKYVVNKEDLRGF